MYVFISHKSVKESAERFKTIRTVPEKPASILKCPVVHLNLETIPLVLLFYSTLLFNVEVILHLTADITMLEISCVEFEFYNTSERQKISERLVKLCTCARVLALKSDQCLYCRYSKRKIFYRGVSTKPCLCLLTL